MEFAFGFMGISPDVFWHMTRREWVNSVRGFVKKSDGQERKDNERARAIAYTVYAMTPKEKGKSNKSIEAFWSLKTEEEMKDLNEMRKKAVEILPKEIKDWEKLDVR